MSNSGNTDAKIHDDVATRSIFEIALLLLSGIIVAAGTSIGIVSGADSLGWPIAEDWQFYLFIIITSILLFSWLTSSAVKNWTWHILTAIKAKIESFGHTAWLFLVGNSRLDRSMESLSGKLAHSLEEISKELAHSNEMVLTSQLFARLAELNHRQPHHILFSHNTGEGKLHPEVGYGKDFRLTGFPVDEAELVMRLWYFVDANSSSPREMWPICSCAYNKPEPRKHITSHSMTIIGSPKYNKACEAAFTKFVEMEQSFLFKRTRRYIFEQCGDNIYCIKDLYNDETWMPDPTPSDENMDEYLADPKTLTDYALILKIPNILNEDQASVESQAILILAGCRLVHKWA